MKRREFLAVGTSSALALSGCQRQRPTRPGVLAEVVREVVVPWTASVLATSKRLETAVGELASVPALDTLRAVRTELKATLLAWKRAQCFRLGPFVDTNAFARALFGQLDRRQSKPRCGAAPRSMRRSLPILAQTLVAFTRWSTYSFRWTATSQPAQLPSLAMPGSEGVSYAEGSQGAWPATLRVRVSR